MEFEPSLAHTSYGMDHMDGQSYLLETPMDSYLQFPPPSPEFAPSLLSNPSASPNMSYQNVSLATIGEYGYTPAFSTPSRPLSPPVDGAAVSPPTLSYTLSNGADASSGDEPSGRNSRGSNRSPPPHVPYAATIPRSHRFNPMALPTMATPAAATRASVRRARTTRSNTMRSNDDSDEVEEDEHQSSGGVDHRREAVRKQRIESEQKRRDELRDGYTKLREALPAMSQKCSKVVLLERASSHIKSLNSIRSNLESQLRASEEEINRLRNLNETLMLNTATQRRHMMQVHPHPQY